MMKKGAYIPVDAGSLLDGKNTAKYFRKDWL